MSNQVFHYSNTGISSGQRFYLKDEVSGIFLNKLNINSDSNIVAKNLVYNTGDQTISGIKTFIGNHNISGNLNVTGNSMLEGDLTVSGTLTTNQRPFINSTGVLLSGEAAPKDIATTTSVVSNTISLDLSIFSYFLVNLNSNITTTNFNNPKTPPEVTSFVLQLSGDGTIRSVAWPTSLRWPGNTAPTITIGPNKVDTYSIFSYDSGVNYYGFPAGYNS